VSNALILSSASVKLIDVDVASIEAFLAVVRLGGFTRAADALHLSQPALSRRIGLLEQELGQAVFERGRRGARLTEAGSTLLPHAQAALASLRDGVAAVEALAQGEAGRLTLAIVGTLASTDLTTRLRRFRDDHPRLQVLLRTGNSAEVSSLVHRGEATLGLRYFPDPAPDIVSRTLYREPLVVVAAAGHPLGDRQRIAAERLREESWVAFPPRRGSALDSFGHVIARTLAAAGLDGSKLVVIDSLTAQKRLVEAGFGLALVPESSVREELGLQTLRRLYVPALHAAIDVTLIHRASTILSPTSRRLIAVLSPPPTERSPRNAKAGRRRRRA
jgi:DNA-binding transcriptional LysR family regulator